MGLSDFKIPLKYFKVPLRSTFDIFKGYLAPKTVPGPHPRQEWPHPRGPLEALRRRRLRPVVVVALQMRIPDQAPVEMGGFKQQSFHWELVEHCCFNGSKHVVYQGI